MIINRPKGKRVNWSKYADHFWSHTGMILIYSDCDNVQLLSEVFFLPAVCPRSSNSFYIVTYYN